MTECGDRETLIYAYLDGELTEKDAQELEQHLGSCCLCRERLASEREFLGTLRRRLGSPQDADACALLRRRIDAALDDHDRHELGISRWVSGSALLSGAAVAAAAAALVLFAFHRPFSLAIGDSVTYEVVASHRRLAPVEVSGAGVNPWIRQYFRPSFDLPRFWDDSVSVRGARLSHLHGRDAARIFYELRDHHGRSAFQVHILDASGLRLEGHERHVVGGRELWVTDRFGYAIVTYRSPEGLAYVFTSEMDRHELLELIARSDLLPRAGDAHARQ